MGMIDGSDHLQQAGPPDNELLPTGGADDNLTGIVRIGGHIGSAHCGGAMMSVSGARRYALGVLARMLLATAVLLVAGAVQAQVVAPPGASEETWASIKNDIFKGRPTEDGTGLVALETPVRAEDAAIVPVTVRATLPAGDTRTVKSFTLVIDENPAPVAATFEIGPDSGVSMIATRVRVNSYSYIHAAAELSDGRLYVVKNYVKASGGCAAPALKDADAAKMNVGLLKLKQFGHTADGPASRLHEAQIMVRHPNYSGLQMDQLTRLYIPAYFVRDLRIWQGDKMVFAMEGGISISEDPNIRFSYAPNGATHLRAEVRDTDGKIFEAEWPIDASAM